MALSEFNIAYFTNGPPADGTIVDQWGQHITIVPLCEYPEDSAIEIIADVVETVTAGVAPIALYPGERQFYGTPEDIERKRFEVVTIEDPSGRLRKLHLDLMHVLETLGIFPDAQWAFDNYSPHSTIKHNAGIDRPFVCDSISINAWQLGQRIVARSVWLGGRRGDFI